MTTYKEPAIAIFRLLKIIERSAPIYRKYPKKQAEKSLNEAKDICAYIITSPTVEIPRYRHTWNHLLEVVKLVRKYETLHGSIIALIDMGLDEPYNIKLKEKIKELQWTKRYFHNISAKKYYGKGPWDYHYVFGKEATLLCFEEELQSAFNKTLGHRGAAEWHLRRPIGLMRARTKVKNKYDFTD